MMQRFWSSLAVQLGKRAGLVSVIGLLITVGLGLGITQLEFATGQDSYLNADEQIAKDNVVYQDLFGGQAMIVVVTMDEGHTVGELYTPETIAQFQSLHDELMASGQFEGVITPVTAIEFSDSLVQKTPEGTPAASPLESISGKALLTALQKEEPGTPEADARAADSAATLARIGAVQGEKVITNPEWADFLLYDNPNPDDPDGPRQIRKALRSFILDPTHVQVIARVNGNESIEREGDAAVRVVEAAEKLDIPNARVTVTGAPLLLKDINDYLRGGMLTLTGAAVGIMVLILLVLFDVRWRLLPLVTVLVGCIWAFGLAGYVGIPLTIVTIAGLPVLLGVGIDYAIQLHARVEEEVVIDRSPHPIQETSRNLGPALLIVTFDAIFAFLALQFARVPMIRDFGLLLAIGIAVICLCSIFMPLAVLGIREYRSPTKGADFREGFLGRLVVKLGSLPTSLAIPFIIASVAIFVGGILVEDDLTLQTDVVEWLDQDSDHIHDFRFIESETRSANELGVFVRATDGGDVFQDDFVEFVHHFTQDLLDDEANNLVTGSSIETTIGDLLAVPGASDIAPTGADVRAAFDVAPDDIKASTVRDGGKAFNIAFRVGPGSLERQRVLVEHILDDIPVPEGISLTPSGLAVVGVGLLQNLEANRVELTYLAIGFVFLFLAIRLRSIVRSLLSLVPVLIAVGLASLVAWAFNITLSPMTAVGGPLVIAVCTEFTSLILLRFVEERQRGLEPQEAADVAAARTGRAFIVSALTGVAGVAVLSLSSLPLLRDFGRIVGMNVLVALISALVVLPPMLVWADGERRRWVSRGLVKTSTEPYIPVDPPTAEEASA